MTRIKKSKKQPFRKDTVLERQLRDGGPVKADAHTILYIQAAWSGTPLFAVLKDLKQKKKKTMKANEKDSSQTARLLDIGSLYVPTFIFTNERPHKQCKK